MPLVHEGLTPIFLALAQYSALMNTYDDKFTSLQGSWQNQIDSLSKNTAEQAAADFKTQRDALEDGFRTVVNHHR